MHSKTLIWQKIFSSSWTFKKNFENEDKYTHPLQAAGINLCNLTQSAIVSKKKAATSDINNYTRSKNCAWPSKQLEWVATKGRVGQTWVI